jgi:GTP pyrophosphokinase
VSVWTKLPKRLRALHKYKQAPTEESGLDVWLNLLKEALENSETNAVDFVEDFKMNLYSKEILFHKRRNKIIAQRRYIT